MYEYSEGVQKRFRVIGFKGIRIAGGAEKGSSNNEDKWQSNLSRARTSILALVLCNRFEYFCTFTFDGDKFDRYDLALVAKKLRRWFSNFKTRFAPNFDYLIVPERHKDGAWHFHGLVRGLPASEFTVPAKIPVRDRDTQKIKLVPNTSHYVRWSRYSKTFGFFDCSCIKNYEACAMYVAKYITKDLETVCKGSHLYFASKGLRRPELVFDAPDTPFPFRPEYEDNFCKISWASGPSVIGTYLPEWYDERCADIYQPEQLPKGMDRGQLERYIFEPLTGEQLLMGGV